MGGTRGEDSLPGPRRVAARMDLKDVSLSAIEPREYDDLVACAETPQALEHRVVEDEPRIRRPFVALPRSQLRIDQGRLDRPIGVTSKRGGGSEDTM